MIYIITSSIFPIRKLGVGGRKKYCQKKAPNIAARKIGPGRKFKIGKRDITNKKTNATA
jgi:hypothetical protein